MVHRSMSGLGTDARALAEGFGHEGLGARAHHVLVARRLAADIAWRDPAYAALSRPERLVTAALSAALVLIRFPGLTVVRRGLSALGLARLEDDAAAWVRARES